MKRMLFNVAKTAYIAKRNITATKGAFSAPAGKDPSEYSPYFKPHPPSDSNPHVKGEALSNLSRNEEGPVPDDLQTLYSKARSLQQLGHNEELLVIADKILEIDPDNLLVLCSKGVTLAKLSRNKEALVIFNKVLKEDPYNFKALSNKGLVLSSLGRNDEALVSIDEILEAFPNSPYALAATVKVYEKVLETDPNNPKALFNKACNLHNLGQNSQALPMFDKVLEINPDFAEAYRYKSQVLIKLDRYDEAIDSLRMESRTIERINKRNVPSSGITKVAGYTAPQPHKKGPTRSAT